MVLGEVVDANKSYVLRYLAANTASSRCCKHDVCQPEACSRSVIIATGLVVKTSLLACRCTRIWSTGSVVHGQVPSEGQVGFRDSGGAGAVGSIGFRRPEHAARQNMQLAREQMARAAQIAAGQLSMEDVSADGATRSRTEIVRTWLCTFICMRCSGNPIAGPRRVFVFGCWSSVSLAYSDRCLWLTDAHDVQTDRCNHQLHLWAMPV